MWSFCKGSKGFILSDQEQLQYNRSPFLKSVCSVFRSCDWERMLFSLNNIRILNYFVIMIVVRTIKIIQCAGAISEMLYYDRTWNGMPEPMELSTSCFLFLSASHNLFLLCIKGNGTFLPSSYVVRPNSYLNNLLYVKNTREAELLLQTDRRLGADFSVLQPL